MTDDKLDEIKTVLEDIRALLLVANQDKLEDLKKRLLKPGSVESQIYDLCDGITTQDIAAKLQKSPDYVRAMLSTLRRKGLVKTVERDGSQVHEQRFQ